MLTWVEVNWMSIVICSTVIEVCVCCSGQFWGSGSGAAHGRVEGNSLLSVSWCPGWGKCVCVHITQSPQSTLKFSPKHTTCLPIPHKLSSQSTLTISPKNTSCLPVQHYLSPQSTLSPHTTVCVCVVFSFLCGWLLAWLVYVSVPWSNQWLVCTLRNSLW